MMNVAGKWMIMMTNDVENRKIWHRAVDSEWY